MALAELIDNSIQAGASRISIDISREGEQSLPKITVEDDGIGMSPAELADCLKFGGSTRFNSRASFGRFGMGLPAASLSQARSIEVLAWQGNGPEHSVTLDVDRVITKANPRFDVTCGQANGRASGCRVIWRYCDRIEYKKLAWLEKALHRELGRIYRRFIANGFELSINGTPVIALDPLMLETEFFGKRAELAFEPLQYEFQTARGGRSLVTVRFSILPIEAWQRLEATEKRRIGILGQSTVSIVRAHREIAHGWYFMGGKRKENYDDWWRCEIEFEPELDEAFGITMSKQGIRPSVDLLDTLQSDLEPLGRILNSRVRRGFEDVKLQRDSQISCDLARRADPELPILQSASRGPVQYKITAASLPTEAMLTTKLGSGVLQLILNTEHPAFQALFAPPGNDQAPTNPHLRTAIELLLLSLARSRAELGGGAQALDEFIRSWSQTYGAMLRQR